MAGIGSGKSNERNRVQATAGRLAYLRNKRFETEGLGMNDHPSLSDANAMAGRNRRLLIGRATVGEIHTPSIRQ